MEIYLPIAALSVHWLNILLMGAAVGFLSGMLGSTRSTMSIAAAQLKSEQLIEYTRGVIHILDAKGLEKKACECYLVIKDHLDNYTQFDSGISA